MLLKGLDLYLMKLTKMYQTKKILKNFPDMNFETDTIIRAENPSIRAQNAIMEMNANNAGLQSWDFIDQYRTELPTPIRHFRHTPHTDRAP